MPVEPGCFQGIESISDRKTERTQTREHSWGHQPRWAGCRHPAALCLFAGCPAARGRCRPRSAGLPPAARRLPAPNGPQDQVRPGSDTRPQQDSENHETVSDPQPLRPSRMAERTTDGACHRRAPHGLPGPRCSGPCQGTSHEGPLQQTPVSGKLRTTTAAALPRHPGFRDFDIWRDLLPPPSPSPYCKFPENKQRHILGP